MSHSQRSPGSGLLLSVEECLFPVGCGSTELGEWCPPSLLARMTEAERCLMVSALQTCVCSYCLHNTWEKLGLKTVAENSLGWRVALHRGLDTTISPIWTPACPTQISSTAWISIQPTQPKGVLFCSICSYLCLKFKFGELQDCRVPRWKHEVWFVLEHRL